MATVIDMVAQYAYNNRPLDGEYPSPHNTRGETWDLKDADGHIIIERAPNFKLERWVISIWNGEYFMVEEYADSFVGAVRAGIALNNS